MAALGRVWAIARMTLLEAVRRRVFTILLLFAAALLSSVLFFPAVDVDARLRLIEIWALRASAVFTAIVGLFLAGFSLPQDFETKRIYLIVTKPISKSLVFLGRYLGYVLLVACFILSMGVLTSLFLRSVQLLSGGKFPALVAYPRLNAGDFSYPGGQSLEDQQAECVVGFGPGQALIWEYRNLRRSSFDDTARVKARLIFGAENDPYRNSGTVEVRVTNPAGEAHETSLSMNTNEEREVAFPSRLIGDDGRLRVVIRAADADGFIATRREWLVLYQKSILFELAFARGLILVLFQSMIVLSITLMSSTFLSAPLSVLLGILLYMVGSIHGYVLEGSRDIDHSLAEIRLSHGKAATPEGIPPALLKFSTATSKLVLAAVPDFENFDFSVWLLKDNAVSWREIGDAGGKALVPVLVLVALGTLVMAFKDFDR